MRFHRLICGSIELALFQRCGCPCGTAISMDPAAAARFAGLALKCLHDEYPNHISLTMDRDAMRTRRMN